jgi:DNA-binding winged helix-turn-helix (wHTH) protein
MSKHTIPGYAFGPFFLDKKGRRLLRDAKKVQLEPIGVKLLEVLIQERGRVLTREELQERVWGVRHEIKDAAYVAIRKVRDALGAYRNLIITVSKTGYTFSGSIPVEEVPEAANNLPQQLTSFIGREKELVNVQKVFSISRLVTLMGPPGTGKTRLALQIAANVLNDYPDGVWLVDLAPITDEILVPKTVASALKILEEPARPLIDTLSEFLKQNRLLLLLDNCEHLIEACASLIEALLRSTSKLQVLATSREALGIIGEAEWVVSPLSVPDVNKLSVAAEEIASYESVTLFIERARLINPRSISKTPQWWQSSVANLRVSLWLLNLHLREWIC